MSDEFDPYYAWLGIPPKDQPPNHYRLLGLELFEANLDVIESAAFRQMGHVRTYQGGKHSVESQQLLNALASAQIQLLNPESKASYDQELRASLEAKAALPPAPGAGLSSQPAPPPALAGPISTAASRADSPSQPDVHAPSPSPIVRTIRPRTATRMAIVLGVTLTVLCLGVVIMFGSILLNRAWPVAETTQQRAVQQPEVQERATQERATQERAKQKRLAQSGGPPPAAPRANPDSLATDPRPDQDQGPVAASGASARKGTGFAGDPDHSNAPVTKPLVGVAELNEATRNVPKIPERLRKAFLRSRLDPRSSSIIESAAGIVDEHFVLTQTLPYEDLRRLISPLRRLGYRPLRLRPFIVAGETRVASVWTRDAVDWRIAIGVDIAGIESADESLAQQGFRPVDVAAWKTDRVQFAAVWVADTAAADRHRLMLDVAEEDFATAVSGARADGFVPLSHHSFGGAQGERRYNLVWYQPDTLMAWEYGDLDRKSHDALLNRAESFQDVCLGYEATGELTYGALLVDRPGVEVREVHGFEADEHRAKCQDLALQGYRPIAISAAARETGRAIVTASVWQLGGSDLGSKSPATASSNPPRVNVVAKASHALRFDGAGHVKVSNSQGLAAHQNAFTAEMWFRCTESTLPEVACLMGTTEPRGSAAGTASGWYVTIGTQPGSTDKQVLTLHTANVSGRMQSNDSVVDKLSNDWHHLAICNMPRGSIAQFAMFLDGRRIQVTSFVFRVGLFDPSDFSLGNVESLSAEKGFVGDMKAFHLSSGVRYSRTFTPAPTFTSDGSTLALLDFAGADSSELADASGHDRHGMIGRASWISVETALSSVATTPEAAPTMKPRERIPAPSKQDRDAGSARVREIFAVELKAASDKPKKLALSQDFLNRGETEEDVVSKFALLFEARELSLEAVDVQLALLSTDKLAVWFEVEPWGLKCDALTRLAANTRADDERLEIAQTALLLADQAIANSDWTSATTLVTAALKANVRLKDREILRAVSRKRKQIQAFKSLWEEAERARVTLASTPDDALANLKLGRYQCFVKDDWENGLVHLAKGSDEELASLAKRDAKTPQGKDALSLANGWYSWSDSAADADKNKALLRARHWYNVAMPQLAGLDRTVAIKKLEQLDKDFAGITAGKKLSWLEGPTGELKRLEGHTSEVKSFDVDRAGTMLVSGSSDGTVRFWDLVKGEETAQIKSSAQNISKVVLIRDDQFVLVIGSLKTAEVWNVRTRKPATALTVPTSIRDSAISSDNLVLACARYSSSSGNISIFNMATGLVAGQLNCPGYPHAVAVSKTGRLVAAGSNNRNVYLWDLATLKMAAPLGDLGSTAVDVVISPDEQLVVACNGTQVLAWEIASGKVVWRSPVPLSKVTFSPDGRRLIGTRTMYDISILNAKDGTVIQRLESAGRGGSAANGEVASLPDARGAITAGYDGIIRIWRLPD